MTEPEAEREHRCAQCGASWTGDESCAARFSQLLALDHSREEPWGSRHGLAFAAYTLQHPSGQRRDVLERCWIMLHRVVVAGDDRAHVTRGLRVSPPATPQAWDVPPLPSNVPSEFSVTIADLGTFDARDYPDDLDRWCRATLNAWEP